MKSPVEEFVDEMLGRIWRQFYPGKLTKQFYQDRRFLIQAITFPARWLNERGVKLPGSKYRQILETVIAAIRQKGKLNMVRRFSVYFLHSVQEHMKHHGEDYYDQAKAARSIASVLPAVTRKARAGTAPDQTTEVLSRLNKIIASRGGRRRSIQPAQADLLPASSFSKVGRSGKVSREKDICSRGKSPIH